MCMHNIGACGYPIPGDDMATVLNTEGPFIEGSAITYSCSAGLTVTGPSTSICMDNRQWEPDPLAIKCIGNHEHSILMITVYHICMHTHVITSSRISVTFQIPCTKLILYML